ncbi:MULTISPECIES: hypothetical protein [Paraburkholderia]|uniref:Uncharacterized protein n=2 Tax=Paraburkholderia TaxID=1822464 RepID=A0A7Y9WHS3_9BURK|nr:hypothetical protein [Paraburkholderia bryophila]NYH19927.1 hypothetical protein [Paraburkholderia bryophila]NYH21044.1 hypothetical protein [Paraburkholderia bryophila]
MSNAISSPCATASATQPQHADACEFDALLALAREAGMLITLDGQIGRERYQSIAGSLHAFRRFAEALRANLVQHAPV